MTTRKEIKEKLMKARHYLQVSSEIIGKHRYPDKKIRPHFLLQLHNHESKRVFPTPSFPALSEGSFKIY
jgi:hypothetical protein